MLTKPSFTLNGGIAGGSEISKSTRPYLAGAILSLCLALAACASIEPVESIAGLNAGMENRSGLSFSPDGKKAYWVEWNGQWGSSKAGKRTVFTAQWQNGAWTQPIPAPITQTYSDSSPFVSPDGRWLYFVSNRPSEPSDTEADRNIWRYRLNGHGQPELLTINSPADEFSPIVTASGALYFASARAGGLGQGDLYRAALMESGFAKPELLETAVNSPTGEWNLWVSADESEMIFEASSRPTNVSVPGDLYYSWRTPDGWAPATPVKALNTEGSDLLPRLHPNGRTLFYTSAPIGGHASIKSADWPAVRKATRAETDQE